LTRTYVSYIFGDIEIRRLISPENRIRLAFAQPGAEPARIPSVHRNPRQFGFWRKLLAFSGPGYLVAVGYMDPGNWARTRRRLESLAIPAEHCDALQPDGILLQALSARSALSGARPRAGLSATTTRGRWRYRSGSCAKSRFAPVTSRVIGSAIALNLLFSHSVGLGRLPDCSGRAGGDVLQK